MREPLASVTLAWSGNVPVTRLLAVFPLARPLPLRTSATAAAVFFGGFAGECRPAVPEGADPSWPPFAFRGMGDWPFFGADAENSYARSRRVGLAKAICASCPAVLLCRSFAVRTGQVFGIWGGLSEQELRFLRHKSAPVKHRGNEYIPVVCHT